MAKKERGLATGMWVLATLANVAFPLVILEHHFKLFEEFDGWKLTGFGMFLGILVLLYFGKHISKWISGMKMNSFKGLIVTLIEIAPFVFLYAFVITIKSHLELYESLTFWIALSVTVGSLIMRLHDYFIQEAREIERFKKYGN